MAQDLALNILLNAKDNASGAIGGIGSALKGLAGSGPAGLAIAGLAAVAAGAVAVGVVSTKMAADYQSSLTTLVTGAGELQKNMGLVSNGILNMSVATGTSTKQLVDGMYMIESAGYHGQDGLNVLKIAAEGAKVGNADLGTVADSLTTILTDYHMKTTQSASAMNGLIATVASGKTHMQDLASSLGNVLPLASSLGISFPQVAGAMATMTNSGMSARRAAMNLANTIRSLAAPNATATKSMKSVGISAQELKDTLSKQGLAAAIQLVSNQVGKTFPAGSVQAVTAFKNIMGGATGYNVALMLGGKNMAAYQSNITAISNAMNKGGSEVQGWSMVQGTLNQKLAQAKAAFDVLLIRIGQGLLPIVTAAASALIPLITGFTALVTGSANLSGSMGGVNRVLQAVGSFLASVFVPVWKQLQQTVMTQVVPAWTQLMAALKPISPELSMFAKLLGGVVGVAIITLVSILAGLIKAFANVLTGVTIAFGGVVQIISGAIQVISGTISFFVDLFTGRWNKLGTDIATIAGGIAREFTGMWNVIRGVFTAGIGAITGFIGGFVSTLINIITHLSDVLVGHSIIPDMVTAIINCFRNLVSQGVAVVGNLVSGLTSKFTSLAAGAAQWGRNLVSSFVGGIQSMAGAAANAASGIANTVKNFLGIHSPAKQGPLADLMVYGPNLVKTMARGMIQTIPTMIDAATQVATAASGVHHASHHGGRHHRTAAHHAAHHVTHHHVAHHSTHHAKALHHHATHLSGHIKALHHHATHLAHHARGMHHHSTHMTHHRTGMHHHSTHLHSHTSALKTHSAHLARHTRALTSRQGAVSIDSGSTSLGSASSAMDTGGITINNTFNINVQNGNPQQIYQYILNNLGRDLRRSGALVTSTSGGRAL